ncbi:unnamed protein product [Aphanomyces euteiches]|uniref:Uncharacterized protein n=1 Tax=Aphanomyces euteiches TaxID=100861 RepID=A0A6G0XI99_9STRA|nr:hypothetical protein Ae201684_004452 [Aphanomyces euteiches]KAH9094190.1 hypothetical protein Ae201684P_016802 [Aphanomyces euteiches]
MYENHERSCKEWCAVISPNESKMVAEKVVRWHKMGLANYIVHEFNRPMFRPFVYGGIASLFICGVLPTWGASDEDKNKSVYWKRVNGKFDWAAEHH